MTNQEFRKEANKLFDKVEYINENSGFRITSPKRNRQTILQSNS